MTPRLGRKEDSKGPPDLVYSTRSLHLFEDDGVGFLEDAQALTGHLSKDANPKSWPGELG